MPDFYQGTELWDLALVDPDNRRPVDFAVRKGLLSRIDGNLDAEAADWSSGHAKLALTHRLLELRAEYPELFAEGRYEPIATAGPHGDHVIAFARVLRRQAIVVAVGRHFAPLTDGGRHWPRRGAIDATLQLENYRVEYDVLNKTALASDCMLPVSAVFGEVPVAVLRANRK